ncbi:MAG: SRPBCC family protein, partial [Limisphaerales bacterium]
MTLRERITIQAAPERIWMLLADPSQWTRWNPKFVSIRRSRSGAVVAGEQFSMISRLKQRESPSDILVQEVMPLRRVIVRQLFTHKNRSRHVDLNLELSAKDGAIEVTQTLNHNESGIPW